MWASFVNLLEAVLIWLSTLTGSLGLGIILFTVFTRIVLLPLTIKQLQSSKKMQELQPLIQELRRKHGKDQQKFTQEMTKLYREHKANPVGGCLPIVVQLPIFIGVYQAVQALALNPNVEGQFAKSFLWLPTLAESDPIYVLPILSVIFQLLVSLMAMPKIQDPQQKIMAQTMLLMPIFFGYIAFTFNSGAVLYWVMGSLLAILQQYFVTGWGSLTNYLTFLPERKGYLTPVTPVVVPSGDGSESTADEPAEAAKPDFWTPLAKLQTTPALAASDAATEAAIADAKNQARGKRRRP
jgi:YidC/Oxa1 family membrane protein insertase